MEGLGLLRTGTQLLSESKYALLQLRNFGVILCFAFCLQLLLLLRIATQYIDARAPDSLSITDVEYLLLCCSDLLLQEVTRACSAKTLVECRDLLVAFYDLHVEIGGVVDKLFEFLSNLLASLRLHDGLRSCLRKLR